MPICGPNQSLTSDQVAQLMRNAGFPDNAIATGVAIAEAESSWQSGNCNPNDPNGGSFGLWQINGIHFLNGTSLACAFDPQCSTNYAYQLSGGGQDWSPWGTYTSGAYQQYLNGNTVNNNNQFSLDISSGKGPGGCPGKGEKCTCPPGYSQTTNSLGTPICKNDSFPFNTASCKECPGSSDPLTKISNFLDYFSQLLHSLSSFSQWLSDPIRIIKLVFGILLIGGAIFLIASPQSQVARTITSTARRVGIR